MTRWAPVYIGLGSNLDDPVSQVNRAIDALAGIPRTELRAVSSLYRSTPMGPSDQPDYINAVAALLTQFEPEQLLRELQTLELAQGRDRSAGERWGPRTLDLDMLVFAGRRVSAEDLAVPHPRIAERNFVVLPLADIAPDLEIPGLGAVRTLAREIDLTGISRL